MRSLPSIQQCIVILKIKIIRIRYYVNHTIVVCQVPRPVLTTQIQPQTHVRMKK
jgi:hypothetical protein